MLSEAPFREVGKRRRPAQAVIVHGVTGGLLAGFVVALWFLVADTLAGHPFRTPTLLAGVLLNREFTEVTFRLVAVYTVLHFAVFAMLGVGMAWVSAAFTAPPRLLLALVFGVLLQEATFYVGLLLVHAQHLSVIAWPHVVGANIGGGLVLRFGCREWSAIPHTGGARLRIVARRRRPRGYRSQHRPGRGLHRHA